MSSAPAKREFDIDFFRGWVCLSLMVLHFYNSALYASYRSMFGDRGEYLIWNWRLGVESFFILAGFMMAHMMRPVAGENVSIGGYLKRRFFRLIIPYWVAVFLFALYRWGSRLVFNADAAPTIRDILAQMFLVQEFFVAPERLDKVIPVGYWSMVSLEQFYLGWLGVYAIALLVFGQNRGRGYGPAERFMAFSTFAVCLASTSLWIWNNVTIPGTNAGWYMKTVLLYVRADGGDFPLQLPLYTVFLSLGMLLYWAIRQKKFRGYFWITLLFLIATAIDTGYSRLWKGLLAAIIFIPLARGLRLPQMGAVRFLAYCGRRSYSIYLVHSIVGIAFIAVTWRLTLKSNWLAIPLTVIAMAISIATALLFYRFVEVPCQSRARSVDYRHKPVVKQDEAALEPAPLPVA